MCKATPESSLRIVTPAWQKWRKAESGATRTAAPDACARGRSLSGPAEVFSAGALDGDVIGVGRAAVPGAAVGEAPGDLIALGLLEGNRLRVFAAAAEGGGGGRAALRAGGEAVVDAIAVGMPEGSNRSRGATLAR